MRLAWLVLEMLVACKPTATIDRSVKYLPRADAGGIVMPIDRKGKMVLGEHCSADSGRTFVKVFGLIEEEVLDSDKALEQVDKGAVSRFVVTGPFGLQGRFKPFGVSRKATGPVVLGGYAGSPTCSPDPSKGVVDKNCTAALGRCALALADVAREQESEASERAHETRPVCVSPGGIVQVDVDDDGKAESFRFRGVRPDALPSERAQSCQGTFARINSSVWPVAAIDIDGDGMVELIVEAREGTRRNWHIYRTKGPASAYRFLATVALSQEQR